MPKKKILIKGDKVHDIGYRLFLMNIADGIGIENFDAENLKEDGVQVVMVLIESTENNINEFFNHIKEDFPPDAKVNSTGIEDYGKRVKPLESFRSGFMAAQQQKFAVAGVGLLNEVKEFRRESGEKQDQTISEVKAAGSKVDNLTATTQDNFNTLNTKYDVISQNMNRIFGELVKERHEFKESMEKERKASDKRTEKLVNAILESKHK